MSRPTNKELREMMGKATAGPWAVLNNGSPVVCDSMVGVSAPAAGENVCAISKWNDETDNADAALIVAAVNSLEELLDENDELREALASLLEEVEYQMSLGHFAAKLLVREKARAIVEKSK